MTPLVSATGVRHAYGATQVLHGVSLELHPGQLTLLMGPSGSGKSTLISILVGALQPTAGRVLLCGSVSKTLAPGYRVGWIAAGRYQDEIERLKFSQSLACPTLTCMAVAEMLSSGSYDRHLRRLRTAVATSIARPMPASA